jgi:LCP family protein required for cell wall assembly
MSENPSTFPYVPLARGRRSWGQRTLLGLGAVLSVLALSAATVVGWGAWKLRSIDRTDVALDELVQGGPRNYLIVGSDSRASGDPNDPGARVDHQPLADTIMILRVDPKERAATMLSLPRDLWLTIAGTGEKGRINAAYAAGRQRLVDTLRDEFQIPINHYVEVDFKGFQQIVEAVDGIPMWFDRAMRDRNSGLDILHPGCTNLNGYGALAFARARHLEYFEDGGFTYDGTGDLGRISRQQLFLRKVIDRAKEKGIRNPLTLKRLVDVGTANVTIDDELSITDLIALGRRFQAFDSDALVTYTLPTSPRTTSGGAAVVEIDRAEAEPMLALFRNVSTDEDGDGDSDDPTDPPTSSIPAETIPSPSSVELAVLNSSGREGAAVDVADDLVAAGFKVPHWGNGEEMDHAREAHSTVRYGSGGAPAALAVAARVEGGADVVADAGLEPGEVVLFIGDDFTAVSSAASPSGQPDGTAGGSTATTAPTTTATTVPPSSKIVGMIPGETPSDRTCG